MGRWLLVELMLSMHTVLCDVESVDSIAMHFSDQLFMVSGSQDVLKLKLNGYR